MTLLTNILLYIHHNPGIEGVSLLMVISAVVAFLLVWGPDFYECLAYFFTLEKDKNGVYQVVLK